MTTTTAPPCPAESLEALARSVAAMRQAAPGAGAGDWGPEDRAAAITTLDGLVRDLTVYRGQVLRAHEKSGRWGSARDRDFADYRSREAGIGRGTAQGEVQLAEGLETMPEVAGAVERGELNLEHARTLTRLQRTASAEVQQALDEGGLSSLVEHATRDQLTAPQLAKTARAWAARIDAAAAQGEFEAVRRRRSLTMRKHAGGIAGEFFLDPVAGEELRTALEAIAGSPAKDEQRTREQRMADALSTMASRTLQVGSDLAGAQVRPHISLLVREETWAAILTRRHQMRTGAFGQRIALPDVPPGELEDGTIVPVGELERVMCDSEITRMVMDATGVPLDVGRTQRTYSKELRRAIIARDRHCQWPGCAVRASWSEVHHITWFSRGGHTSLDQGVCQCSYHHHLIHEHDVQITVLSDGFDYHYPDGTHIGTTRRSQTPESRLPELAAVRVGVGGTPPQPAAPTTPTTTTTTTAPGSTGPPEQPAGPGPDTCDPLPTPTPAPVKVLPPPPPAKDTAPAVATRTTPVPSHPSTYATAPATLWDADPPF